MNRERLFNTQHLIENRSLGFCGIVISREEISNIRLVVIRTDTTKEGDTVLWAQFLNQTLSVQMFSHGRPGKTNLGKTPVLQPLMLTQDLGIRSLFGVLLKALPQKVVEKGRERFWNWRFDVFHDTEHDCVHMIISAFITVKLIQV